ncbi:MAG TPA: cardiolipin synthase [Thermoleophilia bacterium]|nr:cardiolipin synthase [Thermoleophilia bacterium]
MIAVPSPLAVVPHTAAVSIAQLVAWVLVVALLAGVLGVIVALVTDDRDPTTVLAWLLVIALLPVVGLLLYFFIGRNYRRNTPERERLRAEAAALAAAALAPLYEGNDEYVAGLERRLDGTPAGKLVELGRHVTGFPVLPAESIEVYHRGADKFARLLDDLAGAQRSVDLMYLIWEQDELTARVTDVLLDRLAHGVRVRILYDWLSSHRYGKDELKRLAAAGAAVKPCYRWLTHINYRNHMKIALIDGLAAYTGGMNMGQEYIDGGARFEVWRDTSLRLTGPVVAVFDVLFTLMWRYNQRRGEPPAVPAPAAPAVSAAADRPVEVLYSSVATPFKSIRDAYIVVLLGARETVWIQSPYFVPDEPLITAMCAAALSGTDVRLMMTGVPDKKLPFHAAHAYYKQLLDAGVKVYQYTAGFLHAKTVTVDRRWCIIGTCNFDVRSTILHDEVSCVIFDSGIAGDYAAVYEDDLRHCREFTIDDWWALGRRTRWGNSFARLFSRLL